MSKLNPCPALFLTFIIASFIIHSDLAAQPWLAPTEDGANFFDIQRSFNQYWEGKTPERGKGFKVFKRWEHYWEYRVNPDGSFPSPETLLAGLEDYNQLLNTSSNKGNSMAAWTAMGPTTTGGGYAGLGRINAIAFHPTNSSIIWVGSPSGGLWKTTDGGATWSTGYDNFSVLGVSSILITPSNPNIMYVATGDGDAGDTRSIGVYKSTDGGATWAATGLTFTLANYVLIRKLLMDPNDEAHILAATSNGLYRTTNSGASWTRPVPENFYDIEAQTGVNANNFYASTNNGLYRSTDNGLNWTLVQTISGSGRIAIGYSPADTTAVVALCSNSSDFGFLGFYRSTNSGASYALQSSTPNLLGWASDGSDTGGQGWYDLVVAVDPANASTVYIGGVNVWKSTNAGLTWNIKATWNGAGGVQTVHADHHAMEWQNNTTLFDGNDGGFYKTTNGGTNWTHLTNGMQISQMYRLGVSQTTNAVIAGLQDNGTKLRSANGTWTDELGGDGMECAIDYSNAQYMYGELYYGDFFRSSNGGTSWTDINPGGQDGTGAWVTPYIISSNNPATLYIGYNDVYKTTDRGNTWTAISTSLSTSNLTVLADAPSDANVIYAGRSSALYRTINGGTNWATMTIPAGAGSMTYLCVSPTDANVIYAAMSNYTAGSKVYKSTNGGASWTNISGTLPNVPANCIIYQKGSPEGLYVGMDVGVYYRDNITNAWALVGTGLPNVIVDELEIKYDTGKLRAATYGRGLWETDINCVSPAVNAPTVTQPTCTVTTGTIVVNATGNATLEYSINGGTSWQTSSTFANLATGNYNIVVRLQVSPTCSTVYSGNPVVIVAPTPPTAFTVTGGGAYCSGGAGVPVGLSGSQTGVNYQLRLNGVNTGAPVSGTGAAISFGNQTAAGTYTVTGTNTTNSCTASMTGSVTVTVNSAPSVSVTVSETSGAANNDGIICAGASATITATGGGTYLWSTGGTT
ncbi:MAG: WD40/YVTN/BNR-like repeat-containing protein, partial [Bacteroidota bacterium]